MPLLRFTQSTQQFSSLSDNQGGHKLYVPTNVNSRGANPDLEEAIEHEEDMIELQRKVNNKKALEETKKLREELGDEEDDDKKKKKDDDPLDALKDGDDDADEDEDADADEDAGDDDDMDMGDL